MADPELQESPDVPDDASLPSRTGRARRAALLGLRVVAGTVGVAAAVAVIAAVGLVPLPAHAIRPPTVVVTPIPANQTRLCAGGLLRLGDVSGQNAGTASSIGAPSVRAAAIGAPLQDSELATSDAGTGGTPSAPHLLSVPASSGSLLAGAQSQVAEAPDYTGFAAAACSEPSGSIWLVGGSTSVGRTTLLTVANPSGVDATVALTILGTDGAINAPGMAGIVVKPGQQRVIPLAGFAPNVASPVVHVEARGGQVTAYLQQSIVRGLDAGGVDIVNPGADPATHLVIPGVRVRNSVGVNRALALPDWDDVVAAVRVAVPGAAAAKVQVSLVPQDSKLTGLSFEMDVAAGQVNQLPLDSAAETDSGTVAIPDGDYTVVLSSTQPIVGGARVSTAVDPAGTAGNATSDTTAPASDFAWYASAPVLTGDTAVTIAPGASPELSATNTGTKDVALVLKAQGGQDLTLNVPAGLAASIPVATGTTYLLQGAKGLVVGVSYAGDALLAAYPVASARPVSAPIKVHP
jgi:hypothetical protein